MYRQQMGGRKNIRGENVTPSSGRRRVSASSPLPPISSPSGSSLPPNTMKISGQSTRHSLPWEDKDESAKLGTQELVDKPEDNNRTSTNFGEISNPVIPAATNIQQTPKTSGDVSKQSQDEHLDIGDAEKEIRAAVTRLKSEEASYIGRDCRQFFEKIFLCNTYNYTKEQRKRRATILLYEDYIEEVYLKILEDVKDKKCYERNDEPAENLRTNFQRAMATIWNTSDASSEICQRILDLGVVDKHLDMLASPVFEPKSLANSDKIYVVKGLLGIAHNVCRHVDARERLRTAGAVETLQSFVLSKYLMIKTKAILTLAYIIDEEENDKIHASDKNIAFIVTILNSALEDESHKSQKYGFSVLELLRGLNKMAANDSNKLALVRCGALPLYVKCLGGCEKEQFLSAQGLWILAFGKGNKQLIRNEPGSMEGLKKLSQSGNEKIQEAARGALWVLEEEQTTKVNPQHENLKHVMISYQWDNQQTMLWIKDMLKGAGYKVWMDVEQMEGSILEAMASAVENAAVVIICMSQRYKDSPNCRTEAEYTFKCRKDIVPLRLQSRYTPDGWLGAMIGNRLYFDFSKPDTWSTTLPQLIRELKDRGKSVGEMNLLVESEENNNVLKSDSPGVESWTRDDVQQWLIKHDLKECTDKFQEFDGKILQELVQMCHSSPEFYYKAMKDDFKLDLLLLLRFTNVLKSLINDS